MSFLNVLWRFRSLALAGFILLAAALWLATGTLVVGGQGAGKGETQIITLIEGEKDGPLARRLGEAGLLAENHPESTAELAAMTVAQRNALVTGADAPLLSVRTVTYTLQAMPVNVPLRGRTKAPASISAVAETPGIVSSVHVTKGQRVDVGDALCTLDSGTRRAAVAQAEAGLAQAQAGLVQAQIDFDSNAELRSRGLAPANTANAAEVGLAAARAAVSSAEAALDNARAELDRTEIVAKVAGTVEDPLASIGTMLAQGSPCATIVRLDPILFVGSIPEVHIGLARTGLDASIRTVTGQEADGKVTFISATADQATRSFPIEIEIPNENLALRDGMTAQATVNLGSLPGHLLPQSVLTLDDNGVLGVRTVEDGVVAFHAVTIVSDTRDGVWVTGLPATAEIIVIGQEFVSTGQRVNASPAGEPVAQPQDEGTAS